MTGSRYYTFLIRATMSLSNTVTPDGSCGMAVGVCVSRARFWGKILTNHSFAHLSVHSNREATATLGDFTTTSCRNFRMPLQSSEMDFVYLCTVASTSSSLIVIVLYSYSDLSSSFPPDELAETSKPSSNILVAKVLRSSVADAYLYRTTTSASNDRSRTDFSYTQLQSFLDCARLPVAS